MTDSAHHAVATYPVRMRMDEHDVGRSTTLGQTVLSRDDSISAERFLKVSFFAFNRLLFFHNVGISSPRK